MSKGCMIVLFAIVLFFVTFNATAIQHNQGITTLNHQTTIEQHQQITLNLVIKQDGLLVISSQQVGHDLSHRLTLNSQLHGEVNALNISQGPEIAAMLVKINDNVVIELITPPNAVPHDNIVTTTQIIPTTNTDYLALSKGYLALTNMGSSFAKSGHVALTDYQGLLGQALSFSQQALASLEHLAFINYYQLMNALLLYDLGKLEQSQHQIEQLMSIKDSNDSPLTMLAQYFHTQYFRAEIAKSDVLPLLTKVQQLALEFKDNTTLQNASVDICTIHAQNDRNDIAVSCFEKMLTEKLLHNAPYKLAVMTSNLANVYQKMGQHRQAITHRNNALATIENVKDWPGYANVYKLQKALYLRHQATHLLSLGRNNNALTNHLASLRIFKLLNRERFINFTLLDLARLYLSYDQPYLARRFASAVYQSSLKNRASGEDSFYFNAALELMLIHQKLGDIELAQQFYQRALTAANEHNNVRQQNTLLLRSLDLRTPDHTTQLTVLKSLRQRLPKQQKSSFSHDVDIALVTQYLAQRQHGQATVLLQQLTDVEMSFNQHIDALYLNAKLTFQQQQYQTALSLIGQADKLIDSHFTRLDNIGLKRSFYHQHQRIFSLKTETLIALYLKHKDPKYLFEASKTNQITLTERRSNHTEITKKNRRLALAQSVNKQSTSSSSELSIDFIEQLLTLENITNEHSTPAAPSQHLTSTHLPVNTQTLHYVLSSPNSYLFSLHGESINLTILPDRQSISDQIDSLTTAIKRGDPQAFTLAKRISQQILPAPIFEKDDHNVLKLNVIASGALWQLPFNLLPLKDSDNWQGKLLIDEYAVSKTTHFNPQEIHLSPQRFLVISDPVYSFQDGRVQHLAKTNAPANDTALPRLKSTRLEYQAILKYFPQTQIHSLTGFSANKENVVSSLRQDFEVIHIASHGFANNNNHRDAGLYFSAIDTTGQPTNGLLSLYEIEQLTSNAQLVILSACQTNVGTSYFKRPSDGIALSFLHTGVSNVIASYWQVPSRSTAALMQAFYYQLSLTNTDYSAALRAAMLTMRKKYTNPSRWASFALIQNS